MTAPLPTGRTARCAERVSQVGRHPDDERDEAWLDADPVGRRGSTGVPEVALERDQVAGVSAMRSIGRAADSAHLADLMNGCTHGHDEGFAELYDLTSPRVYGIVLRVVRSPEHAAEVTQEVYVEVWRHAARYARHKGSVLGWMTTMAHRRAVDRVRSVTSAMARDGHDALIRSRREVDQVWEVVEQKLDAERVRRGLASLTRIQREALGLAYFAGYTHSQIAAMLKLPLGTVKTRIRDGLICLRDALGTDARAQATERLAPP